MRNLLKSRPISPLLETRDLNSQNGSDAEFFGAARLILACRGEVTWGSREEDNSKIDVILSCEHPWHPNERMMVLVQMKSGKSFGESTENGFKLKSAAIKAAKRTSHSICIIWVCRETNSAYWAYIRPSHKAEIREYKKYHEITPATLFDLARCISKNTHHLSGGSGLIIRQRRGDLTNRRKNVYLSYKKTKEIFSPVMGKIELTRLGWRHMFRASRALTYKQSSLELIPYLRKIVEQNPTDHTITYYKDWERKGFIYRNTEHLLKYSNVQYSEKNLKEKQSTVVLIKVIEEIRFPKNWEINTMLGQAVERRVVLKSAYHKLV